jgi:hypothetical protein
MSCLPIWVHETTLETGWSPGMHGDWKRVNVSGRVRWFRPPPSSCAVERNRHYNMDLISIEGRALASGNGRVVFKQKDEELARLRSILLKLGRRLARLPCKDHSWVR